MRSVAALLLVDTKTVEGYGIASFNAFTSADSGATIIAGLGIGLDSVACDPEG